jgi:hypothetical protein
VGLVEGIRNEVGFFITYSFVHVARGLNEAAHILAKTVITNVVDDVWLEEIPSLYFGDYILQGTFKSLDPNFVVMLGSVFYSIYEEVELSFKKKKKGGRDVGLGYP